VFRGQSTGVEEDEDDDQPVERLRLDYSSTELATSAIDSMKPPTTRSNIQQTTCILSRSYYTIIYWHHNAVCLSVCLWRCAVWLNDTPYIKSECEQVNRKCPPRNTTVELWTPYSDSKPSPPKFPTQYDRLSQQHLRFLFYMRTCSPS